MKASVKNFIKFDVYMIMHDTTIVSPAKHIGT